jgi:hypothetical protein
LPLSREAIVVANLPKIAPSASTTHHFPLLSDNFALDVYFFNIFTPVYKRARFLLNKIDRVKQKIIRLQNPKELSIRLSKYMKHPLPGPNSLPIGFFIKIGP